MSPLAAEIQKEEPSSSVTAPGPGDPAALSVFQPAIFGPPSPLHSTGGRHTRAHSEPLAPLNKYYPHFPWVRQGSCATTLELPGLQDQLVHAVAAANPRTVVVVNSGPPVLMPWRHEVAATSIGYFGGQECGNALAE
ncbi:glycoside hydrolase family 3 C-terminal domain-containing protein [Arthrobacter pascens]|uniref:glycoside hydrolase family 3 C-terminal domain-containing protein n=1 Tax=Arthrobacter pascens TaxID=1677 RepID=UPI0027D76F8F|nr:glycoside hydrolase family 3 C-terminal domain-containing protein [Arthrobacter pascens]